MSAERGEEMPPHSPYYVLAIVGAALFARFAYAAYVAVTDGGDPPKHNHDHNGQNQRRTKMGDVYHVGGAYRSAIGRNASVIFGSGGSSFTSVVTSRGGQSVVMSDDYVEVNGRHIHVPRGASTHVVDGVVYVNGRRFEDGGDAAHGEKASGHDTWEVDVSDEGTFTVDVRAATHVDVVAVETATRVTVKVAAKTSGRDEHDAREALDRVWAGVLYGGGKFKVQSSDMPHTLDDMRVTVTMPRDKDVSVTASSVSFTGKFRVVTADVGSGRCVLQDAVATLNLEASSGDLVVRDSEVSGRVECGSGDITMENVRVVSDLYVRVGSGDADVVTTNACRVKARVGSGDKTVRGARSAKEHPLITARAGSGDLSIVVGGGSRGGSKRARAADADDGEGKRGRGGELDFVSAF